MSARQTHMEGFGALPSKDNAPVGPTYVRSVKASAGHASDWLNNPVVREQVRRGARRAVEVRKARLEAIARERDAVIIKLVRAAPAPKTMRQVHELYLQVAPDHGWPRVGYRMFGYYVQRLVRLGKLMGRCVSFGKGGRFTVLRVVPQGAVLL